jgi:hypothetical protein
MRSTLCAIVAVLLTLPIATIGAQERAPFQVGDIRAAPGQRSSGFLEIRDGVDEGTQVPMDRRTRDLALAFGLDHIVIDPAPDVDPNASQFVDHTAISRGVPALTTETGKLGSPEEPWVDMTERGVWGVMAHLGMVERDPEPAEGVVWLEDYVVVTSPATGVFRPEPLAMVSRMRQPAPPPSEPGTPR